MSTSYNFPTQSSIDASLCQGAEPYVRNWLGSQQSSHKFLDSTDDDLASNRSAIATVYETIEDDGTTAASHTFEESDIDEDVFAEHDERVK